MELEGAVEEEAMAELKAAIVELFAGINCSNTMNKTLTMRVLVCLARFKE